MKMGPKTLTEQLLKPKLVSELQPITPTMIQPPVTPTPIGFGLPTIVPPYIPKPSLALGKKGPSRKFKGMGEQFIGSSYAAKVFDIRSGKEIKGSFGGMFTGLEIKPLTLGGEARVRRKGSKPINNGKAKKKTKKKTKR